MTRRGAVVGFVVAGFATLLACLWFFQRHLIYFPSGDPGPAPTGWLDATVTTTDGISLGVWHRPPDPGRSVVVVFPGNAGNRGDRMSIGSGLAGAGFGVVLMDYRGYGGNDGSPNEAGLAFDAEAVAGFARREYPDRPLLFFGESLGTAVAVGEAATRPPDGIVLRSPFTTLADAASANYFGIPTAWILRDSYRTIERIGAIDVPVTVIAGTADSIIPIGQSREVHRTAASSFEWVAIEGADHNDTALTSGPDVIAAVVRLAEEIRE